MGFLEFSHKINNWNFEKYALEIFYFQAKNNLVYSSFLKLLKIDVKSVKKFTQIPFLPIQFFKTHEIISSNENTEQVFYSSGTTGIERSKHYITDLNIYEKSFTYGFKLFYGNIKETIILALLPNYLEQKNSSLVYMVNQLIQNSNSKHSGFYLNDLEQITQKILQLEKDNKKVILIGVSYALLDLIEYRKFNLKNTIVMETGGMKGRRKEMIKEELHHKLKVGFGVDSIHSEYGMTELLSQAYSKNDGLFYTPPWMKILIRDTEDALTLLPHEKTGGINIIDLANVNSCSFIATQDLGKTHANGSFEVVGRFDNSDIRGCNLMVV